MWALLLLVVALSGCRGNPESTLYGAAPVPETRLRLTVGADTVLGDFGRWAAEDVRARLLHELATRGPLEPDPTSPLWLRVRLSRADPGETAANVTIGWDIGSVDYALQAELLHHDRLLDRLRVDGPLVGGSGLARPRELLADDAAFRLWSFLWERRPLPQPP